MVEITQYTRRAQPAGLSRAQSTPQAFGAGLGRQMEAIGEQVYDERIESIKEDQLAEYEEITSNFILSEQERLAQMKVERDRSPENFTKDYLNLFNDSYSSFIPEGASEFQKSMFDKERLRLKREMGSRAISFEMSRKESLRKERIATATDNYINMVQVDASQASAALNNLKRLHGEGSPEYNAARLSVHDAVLSDYVENKRIDDAEEYLRLNSKDFGTKFDAFSGNLKKAREEIELEQRAAQIFETPQGDLQGQQKFNPFRNEDLKAANKYFEAMGGYEAVMSMSPQAAQSLVNMAGQTFVPKAAEEALEYLYANGGPAQKLYASDVITKIKQANPKLAKTNFKGQVFDDLAVFGTFVQATGAEEAMKHLQEVESLPLDVVNAREDLARSITSKDDFKVPVRDIAFAAGYDPFGPNFLRGTPDAAEIIKQDMEISYKALYQEGFKRYGNERAAKNYAIDKIATNTEVTQMNGVTELMPNAPENLVNVAVTESISPNFVNEYLSEAIKSEGLSDVIFQSDEETQRSLSALERSPSDPTKNIYGEPYGVKYRVFQTIDLDGEEIQAPINNEQGDPLYMYIDPEGLQDFVNNYDVFKKVQRKELKEKRKEIIGPAISSGLVTGGL